MDKIGIEKNKREYEKIKREQQQINAEIRGFDGRVLIVESINKSIIKNFVPTEGEAYIEKLNNEFELNYDGLFGENSLDCNIFNDLTIESNSFGLDISNSFEMKLDKKIWCEELKQDIIPTYMYNSRTGNYHYESKEVLLNSKPYKSNPMNYVQFKYFLRDNGVIKF